MLTHEQINKAHAIRWQEQVQADKSVLFERTMDQLENMQADAEKISRLLAQALVIAEASQTAGSKEEETLLPDLIQNFMNQLEDTESLIGSELFRRIK